MLDNPLCSIFCIDLYRKSNDVDFLDFVDLGFEETQYVEEKRKGGESSYKAYQPLKVQVKALCMEELRTKNYSSILQLSEKVATRMVKEFPGLLQLFKPYKNHLADGSDWITPTFYKWCTKAYNEFENQSSEVVNS